MNAVWSAGDGEPAGVKASDLSVTGGSMGLLAAVVCAVALTSITIGTKSLWLDEAFSVALVKVGWTRMGQIQALEQTNMSIYHVLLYMWVDLFGTSEAAVRAMSAVFSILSVPSIYLLGSLIEGRRCGVNASFLLATNAFYIEYAQEARGYSLVLFLSILSSLLFFTAVRRRSWAPWVGYVLISGVAVYAHVFAVLVIAAHYLSLVRLRWRTPVDVIPPAVSLVTIAILIVPFFVLISDQAHLEWLGRPTLLSVAAAIASLTGHGVGLLTLYFALCSRALFSAWRSQSQSWSTEFVATWLATPFIFALAFSLLVKPIFLARYLIVCLPPLVLLTALGLAHVRSRALRVMVILLLGAFAARSVVRWYTVILKDDWRSATRYVLSEARAEDGIAFSPPYVRLPFEYYVVREKRESRAPTPMFPAADWGSLDPIAPELSQSADAAIKAFSRLPPRLWMIARDDTDVAVPVEMFRQLTERQVKGVRVRLYERVPQ